MQARGVPQSNVSNQLFSTRERERRMAEREMEVGYRNEACSTTAMNGLCLAITVFVSSKRFCKKLRQQCQIS
jgi:hypothetical protein